MLISREQLLMESLSVRDEFDLQHARARANRFSAMLFVLPRDISFRTFTLRRPDGSHFASHVRLHPIRFPRFPGTRDKRRERERDQTRCRIPRDSAFPRYIPGDFRAANLDTAGQNKFAVGFRLGVPSRKIDEIRRPDLWQKVQRPGKKRVLVIVFYERAEGRKRK